MKYVGCDNVDCTESTVIRLCNINVVYQILSSDMLDLVIRGIALHSL